MSRGALVAGAGFALLACALVAAALAPDRPALPSALAGLAVFAVAAGLTLERAALRKALSRRAARHGALAAGYTVAVLVMLAAVGFLAGRHRLRLDTTRHETHTLEPETLRIVKSIPADGGAVEIIGVDSGGVAGTAFQPLLGLFADASPRISVRITDAQREPALARSLGLARFPVVVVRWTTPEGELRQRQATLVTEKAVAQALEQALMGVLPVAYVVAGHGESAVADQGPQGLVLFAQALRGDNHDVRQLFLGESGVPADAAFVIVAGPEGDYLPQEAEALRRYGQAGGRLLVFLGPHQDGRERPVLAAWLREAWGVSVRDDLVADFDGLGRAGGLAVLLVKPPANATNPIVAGFDRLVVLPLCRSLHTASAIPEGVSLETLLQSGPRSWVETDLSAEPAYGETDEKGPVPLAIAAMRSVPGERTGRLVVVGCSRLPDNADFFQAGNPDFVLNSVAWLTEREAEIATRLGGGSDGTVVIPYRQGVIILLSAAVLPIVVLLGGVVTWWHRRRL